MVRYLEHLDSLGLGHAKQQKSWVGCKYIICLERFTCNTEFKSYDINMTNFQRIKFGEGNVP